MELDATLQACLETAALAVGSVRFVPGLFAAHQRVTSTIFATT